MPQKRAQYAEHRAKQHRLAAYNAELLAIYINKGVEKLSKSFCNNINS